MPDSATHSNILSDTGADCDATADSTSAVPVAAYENTGTACDVNTRPKSASDGDTTVSASAAAAADDHATVRARPAGAHGECTANASSAADDDSTVRARPAADDGATTTMGHTTVDGLEQD